MKRKNIAAMATSIALVGVVAVGGTLALLTSQSNGLTNTFTVGKGYHTDHQDLTLDEAQVKQETSGTNIGGYVEDTSAESRVSTTQNYANLVEKAYLAKDPQFHIAADCDVASSWIVAKVSGVNTDLTATTLKFTDVNDDTVYTPADKVVSGTWYKVTNNGDGTYGYDAVTLGNMGDGVYIYDASLAAGQSTEDLFQQLQVDNFVPGKNPSTIEVSGYAVEGIANATFDNSRDAVMNQVKAWAFSAQS